MKNSVSGGLVRKKALGHTYLPKHFLSFDVIDDKSKKTKKTFV